jgi:hypothetical protein
MHINELPALTCNVLARTQPEYLEYLPAVLSEIERESLLGAVVIAYPDFIRTALECVDVEDHEGLNLRQQLFHIAAGYVTGRYV